MVAIYLVVMVTKYEFQTGLTYFEVICSGRVSSQFGYHTLLKFLRHLFVYSVTNFKSNGRKNG